MYSNDRRRGLRSESSSSFHRSQTDQDLFPPMEQPEPVAHNLEIELGGGRELQQSGTNGPRAPEGNGVTLGWKGQCCARALLFQSYNYAGVPSPKRQDVGTCAALDDDAWGMAFDGRRSLTHVTNTGTYNEAGGFRGGLYTLKVAGSAGATYPTDIEGGVYYTIKLGGNDFCWGIIPGPKCDKEFG
uniref:Uncharacterized protein n=2 Tax=Odontella aurita TaxID=265563 RepID=A0A7S4JHG2_9STRA|mmetsp:Transcript_46587/g.141118  ORF Transcript_46587/g.141118 Transcript_46587/m.141118 type:complete len:186 (+) Transcript_46587:544-1101(+)